MASRRGCMCWNNGHIQFLSCLHTAAAFQLGQDAGGTLLERGRHFAGRSQRALRAAFGTKPP